MPTQKFQVAGLLHSDETRVAQGVERLDGVIFALASSAEQCAEVEFDDDQVTEEEILRAIAEFGYAARPAS